MEGGEDRRPARKRGAEWEKKKISAEVGTQRRARPCQNQPETDPGLWAHDARSRGSGERWTGRTGGGRLGAVGNGDGGWNPHGGQWNWWS